MERKEQLYEGKAKKVYATSDPDICIVSYKDDATAFNGEKKGTIRGKGVINNRITNYLMKRLSDEAGIPTHYIKELSDTDTAVKRVRIIPLEVIVRNVIAGSLSKRVGKPEGTELRCPILEFSYKDDELGDPMVNDYHILAMGWATEEELDTIKDYAMRINDYHCTCKHFLKNCILQNKPIRITKFFASKITCYHNISFATNAKPFYCKGCIRTHSNQINIVLAT